MCLPCKDDNEGVFVIGMMRMLEKFEAVSFTVLMTKNALNTFAMIMMVTILSATAGLRHLLSHPRDRASW